MTTEDDFQRLLDADPADHHTRLVFADWLEERGDPRAEGYRALGTLRKFPIYRDGDQYQSSPWEWWSITDVTKREEDHDYLSEVWYRSLDGYVRRWSPRGDGSSVSCDYATRRGAEDAAAIAFTKLPDRRRQELLGVQPCPN